MTTPNAALLTPRMLEIPARVAAHYAGAAHAQGVDADELESAANLAFATALASYDAGGGSSLASWLYGAVRWKVRNTVWPPKKSRGHKERLCRDRTRSLDARASEDSQHDLDLHGVLGEPDGAPEALVDAPEEAAAVLARLGPVEAAVLTLVCSRGLGYREAGERLGVSHTRIEQILKGAKRKARKSVRTREGHRAAGYRPTGARMLTDPAVRAGAEHPKRRANYDRAREQMVRARRALGVVRLDGWYLIDRASRTAWGDWPRMAEALAAVGITLSNPRASGPGVHVAASLGWPSLMPCEAIMLDVLVREGPLTNARMTGRPGLPPAPMQASDVACRLVRMGLASSTGRGGARRALYSATPKALATRGPTTGLEPARGYALRDLQQQEEGEEGCGGRCCCWRVLPPHLVAKRRDDGPSSPPLKEAT